MTPAQQNAIREADAYLRCAGLPTYSEVTAQPAAVSGVQRASIRLVCEMLDSYIECIKASGEYERWHYIPQVEVARDDIRSILALRPQAESEQEKELRRSLAEAQATISERNAEIVELQRRIHSRPQAVPMSRKELGEATARAHIAFCLAKFDTYEEALLAEFQAHHGIAAPAGGEG